MPSQLPIAGRLLERVLAHPQARPALRFGVTGVAISLLHVLIASCVIRSLVPSPMLANGIAFSLCTLVSYQVNSRWSFAHANPTERLPRFVLVSLAGLAASLLVAASVDSLGFHYGVGIAAVIMLVPLLTFTLHSRWTFA
jgi:putative flippase GtrA